MAKQTKGGVRLSTNVVPIRYKLSLKPDFDGFTFDGEESIQLDLKKSTSEITLHSIEIEIEEASYQQGKKNIDGDVKYNEKDETAILIFPQKLGSGKGALKLKFKGVLNDKLRGFYRSKYTHQGKEKYLATTQFESTDARRAFPCFDEPAQKAIFDITLIVQKNLTAISNTLPRNISEHEGEYQAVEFSSTPKMSTYLLAFIVGELEFISTKTKRGVLVRVFTTPGKKDQAKFALDVAAKTIDFYESYYGEKYPLPVMDMIAIPDFSAGAMENWGAVTYRETALLIDPKNSSSANKQRVAIVVAHELAHQWFGNLVTMEWWTHLWLNEGFASYMEYLAVDHLFPKWQMWSQFLFEDHEVAMKLDSLNSTHPIEVEVHHPDEISEIFDKVSYSKGASVIRMLAEYLGYKDFRDGLRFYLKKHKFANATTDDLWKAFEKISGKKVTKVMSNWTSKPGYPLLKISTKGKDLEVTQERFFSSPISAKKFKDKTIWSVPFKTYSEDGKERNYLMDKKSIKVNKDKGWVKLNSGESSLIRVSYPEDLLGQFEDSLRSKKIHSLDRLGLIRDVFDLSEAGVVSTVAALKLVKSYIEESDYTIWHEIAAHLDDLESLLADQRYYSKFEDFAREVFADVVDRIGWDKKSNEAHTDSLLRELVLYKFGSLGDKGTIKRAQDLFKKGGVDPNLRRLVYNLVAENGKEVDHSKFIKMYLSETLMQEKDRISMALSKFKDKRLLQKTLDFAISGDVRSQDAVTMVGLVFGNPLGRDLAWEHVKKNWKLFKERYSGGHFLLPKLIGGASNFTSVEKARDIEKFFAKNPSPEVKRTKEQVLEQIYSNSEWLKRDNKRIGEFLNA